MLTSSNKKVKLRKERCVKLVLTSLRTTWSRVLTIQEKKTNITLLINSVLRNSQKRLLKEKMSLLSMVGLTMLHHHGLNISRKQKKNNSKQKTNKIRFSRNAHSAAHQSQLQENIKSALLVSKHFIAAQTVKSMTGRKIIKQNANSYKRRQSDELNKLYGWLFQTFTLNTKIPFFCVILLFE